ncbi:MAG TPA: hypothetical protein VNV43_08835 [Candidatus Acidoferrales bacterium]|nr:hypothetical protein [Candidatus Acidoferrales bacterium]
MDKIADEQIQAATKLREILRPYLIGQHDLHLARAEIEARGVEDYRRVFGNRITTRYWRELFMRTVRRDNGFEEWNRLEIYLPERLKQKETPASIVSTALADDFAELEQFIQACSDPSRPTEKEQAAVWTLAFEKLASIVSAGDSKKSASRRVRQFLFARATRNYDGIHSLQCVSGDDFTLNTYFYVPDGKGWFDLTRGQVILFIDFRSLRILGWALEPRKSYSSLTIRSLCTHVFGEFGVPAILYFERGLWKSATLLKGKTGPFEFTEITQGLREFNIKFIHAVRPRTKVVERIGGMFQDIAEAEPGYCGRDERRDAPESLRRQMAEVEARKIHPSQHFYSLDEWNRRIGELVDQYNSEVQQGHILDGLSPDQAFEKFMNQDDPPIQFSAGLRYLLSHDKRQERVTLNGVTIRIGKQKFNYRGQEIAHLVGRDVLAWFDPENRDTIVVTNLDRTNPICVARSENPSALECLAEPDSGRLGRELTRIEDQASYMKTRFQVVKAKFPLPQRQLLASARTLDLGREIETQRRDAINRIEQQKTNHRRARTLTQRTGIVVPESAEKNVRPEDAQFLSEFLEGETASVVETSGKKNNYQLKPFEKFKPKGEQ